MLILGRTFYILPAAGWQHTQRSYVCVPGPTSTRLTTHCSCTSDNWQAKACWPRETDLCLDDSKGELRESSQLDHLRILSYEYRQPFYGVTAVLGSLLPRSTGCCCCYPGVVSWRTWGWAWDLTWAGAEVEGRTWTKGETAYLIAMIVPGESISVVNRCLVCSVDLCGSWTCSTAALFSTALQQQ